MSQPEVIENKIQQNNNSILGTNDINYKKYEGRGGAFLITPIGNGSVFSREQFTEEHKMFQKTAKETK